ncbi:type I restriction enzyme HsdR N-terminal domain-containing protein [Flavisolibacter sp. BT320]|nr:type I restriction enzyme HsdR N-terminal domain-containing protein [Flavisolibacter longurius]
MISISFPTPAFKIEKRGGRNFVYDGIRRQWILLTEEEWVRQNFVAYLLQVLKYPKEAVVLEKAILVNGLKKRFDILVFDHEQKPWMLIECKAPLVGLSEAVLQQVLRYHLAVPVPWLLITNGVVTTGWRKEGSELVMVAELPKWESNRQ